jgi:hypothetical protein
VSDEQCRCKSHHPDHRRKTRKGLPHSDPVDTQAKGWRGQHGTKRKKAHEVAVDQPRPGGRAGIYALLHDDKGHAAAGGKQQSIAKDQPAQRRGNRRKGYPSAGQCGR